MDSTISDDQLREATVYFGEIYDGMTVFDMSEAVKNRASDAYATSIGTLDAIHLATAQLWAYADEEPVVVFTFDNQMRTCAQAMGIHTL